MRHTSTKDLFAYWDRKRGARSAPRREEIDPGDIRHVLADTFILGETGDAQDVFRIAGTRVCAVFGRELKGSRLLDFFTPAARAGLRAMIGGALEDRIGAVAHLRGTTEGGRTLDLEMLLLPLTNGRSNDVRNLGLLVPLENAYWLGTHAVEVVDIVSVRHLGPIVQHFSAPALVIGRRAAPKLVLHQGGRHD